MANVRPGDWRWLFRGDFGRRTVIVWTQWILYDIGSYGFGLYAPAILAMLGFKGALALLLSSLLYIPGFLGALGAAYLNDVAGRRVLQLIGFGGSALGMVFVAIGAYLVGLVAVIIGVIGLILWYGIGNLGPGNTMGLYAIELFPTKLRSTSMGSATAITRFVSFLSAFEFPYIPLTLGKLTFFEFLVIVTFIAFIWTLFCTPETKGIPLELIAIARTKCPGLHPKLEISAVGTERGR
jgi:Sugar (and other) transporter.